MCAGPACSGCTKCLLWYLIVPSVSIDQFSTDLANCIATSTNDCNCVSLLRLSWAKLVQPPMSHCRVLNCQGCCSGTAGHPVSPINVNQPELVAKHLLLEQILKGLRWAEPGRHVKIWQPKVTNSMLQYLEAKRTPVSVFQTVGPRRCLCKQSPTRQVPCKSEDLQNAPSTRLATTQPGIQAPNPPAARTWAYQKSIKNNKDTAPTAPQQCESNSFGGLSCMSSLPCCMPLKAP